MTYEEILKIYKENNPPKYSQEEVYKALHQMLERYWELYGDPKSKKKKKNKQISL